MKLAYVAHRIRDPRGHYFTEQHIRAAEAVTLELWKLGFSAICPGANTRHAGGFLPDEIWLQGDLEMVRRSDCVVMAPGYEESLGALGERASALQHGIPVFYWPQDREEIRQFATTGPSHLEQMHELIPFFTH